MVNFFKDFFGTKSSGIPSSNGINKLEDGSYFYPVGAGTSFVSGDIDNKRRLYLALFIPELNAILNLRARAAGNMEISVVDKDTDKPVKVKDPIAEQLKNPNYFQSKQEFFGQTSLFRDIFGSEYIYAHVPSGLTETSGIFTLPPYYTKIEKNNTQKLSPFFLYDSMPDSVRYIWDDSYELEKSRIVHLNDNCIKMTPGDTSYLKGHSKIDSLQAPLENIWAAYEARNVLIVYRGAIGILSNASKDGIGGVAPLNPKEKEKLQAEFRKYGLTKQQWQVIITNLSLDWQQMSIDVDKLKLFEETIEDTLRICDEYGVPPELLGVKGSESKFSNKREANVQFYRDTVIPDNAARIDGINKIFFKDKDYRLKASYEHLPIFAEELKDRARSLMLTANALDRALTAGAITKEEYREEMRKFGIGK